MTNNFSFYLILFFIQVAILMLLWNYLLPQFGIQTITYWQAAGFKILSTLLFKSNPQLAADYIKDALKKD